MGGQYLTSLRGSGWLTVSLTMASCQSWSPCDVHQCPFEGGARRRPYIASRTSASAVAAARSFEGDGLGQPSARVRSIRHGLIDCFEPGARRTEPEKKGELAYCEGSALVFDGQKLLLASDKPIPGKDRTSAFEVPLATGRAGSAQTGDRPRRYLTADAYAEARKFEDATVTPEGDRVFLTTGFDRVLDDRDEWDGYNVLLTYPVGKPEAVQVVGPDPGARTTSVDLRAHFRAHLPTPAFPKGAPYFKIEAVAAAPGRRLLFGVRELGASYRFFEYAAIILEARWYETEDGTVVLDPASLRPVYRRDTLRIAGHEVGLSSLEYDPQTQRYYLLTSFEYEEPGASAAEAQGSLGGFLWTLTPEALRRQEPPSPVIGPSGRALEFVNKPEGLTVLGPDQLMVLFDDDRVLECGHPGHMHRREPHQTPMSLLDLDVLHPEPKTARANARTSVVRREQPATVQPMPRWTN